MQAQGGKAVPVHARSGMPRPACRNGLLALGLAWLSLLAACGRPPELPRLNPGDAIVAFGDSLTHGTGASPEQAYPAVLSRLIHRPVINAGVPGETTAEARERLASVLDEYHPKLVLLCLGGNDMLKRQDRGQTEANLRAMIEAVRSRGAWVVLIGVPEPGLFSGPPALFEKLANEFGLPYEGEIFNDVLRDNRLKSDLVHANADGYREVAERLAELLEETGALP